MVKINSLEIENVKRVKAVKAEPTTNGITVIGGGNNQGKTSVLDSIAWALGGDRYKPSNPAREGSVTPPELKLELDNGLIVKRTGKNSDLKVIDPEGRKSGQALLDKFISKLALDLPKFMNGSSKEKADTLLNIIGVGPQLYALEAQEEKLTQQRLTIGQMQRQKQGAANEMENYPDAPVEPISASELIERQSAILAKNGENQRHRDHASTLAQKHQLVSQQYAELMKQVEAKKVELEEMSEQLAIATKTATELRDESTETVAAELAAIDATNEKVRVNQAKAVAQAEAEDLKAQYEDMNNQIDTIRSQKMELLKGANLPLPDLSVEAGELIYCGQKWDGMSASEQLKVATAIVRQLNPECGFVLVDKLEQMDLNTLAEFGTWAETEGLQVIATRVSTGDECSIIIEDGYGSNVNEIPKLEYKTPLNTNETAGNVNTWQEGGSF